MPNYDLDRLGWEEFENLVQALLKEIIGAGTITFGSGPDAAREATFEGRAPYPSPEEQWEGRWIFQAKLHNVGQIGPENARKAVLRDLGSELYKVAVKYEHPCDNYILVTNVPFTSVHETGTHDRIVETITEFREEHPDAKIPINIRAWGGDEVSRYLDQYPDIRKTYRHLVTPGDVLAKLLDRIERYDLQPPTGDGERLSARLKGRLQFLFEAHSLFGGREEQLDELDRFVKDRPGGYAFVTGLSGFGKTALLVNWVRRLQEQNQNICYHFISRLRDRLPSEGFTMRNLCQQLAAYHLLTGTLPENRDELRSLFPELLHFPAHEGEKLIVVLDGLDEADGWSPEPEDFPSPLPGGVYFVFSAREIRDHDWLASLKLSPGEVKKLTLKTMGEGEIAHLLRAAGEASARWADDSDFVSEMLTRSKGDPFYLHYLIQDVANRDIASLEELSDQPEGIDDYFETWWAQITEALGNESVKYLLGYLVVSKGGLTRADLADISSDDPLDSLVVDPAILRLQRFVLGDEKLGYRLCHDRFKDWVTQNKIMPLDRSKYLGNLLAYCARWRPDGSRYALTHYARHLADAGGDDPDRIEELYNLISNDWMRAKLAEFYSPQPFSEDVELAIAAASQEPINWAQLVRGCLLYASLGSMATNVPPEVLGTLALVGDTHQVTKARGYAALMQDRNIQADAFRRIGQALSQREEPDKAGEVLKQALAAAEAIGYEWAKAEALRGVAAALAEVGEREAAAQAARQALGAAEAIGDEDDRAQALSGVAAALAEVGDGEALRQALGAAQAIGDEGFRAQALSGVAAALAEVGNGEALRHALGAAEAIWDGEYKAQALSGVAAALAEVGEREAAAQAALQALAAAEAIGYEGSRAQALSGVAAALAEMGNREALRHALGAAEAIWDGGYKAQALSRVAAALAEVGEREAAAQAALQALGAAEAIGDERWKPQALSGVAAALAEMGEREAAAQAALQALAAAEAIWWHQAREEYTAQALSGVAAALAEVGDGEALRQALGTAQAIGDEKYKAQALSGVAAALAEVGEREAALAAAEAIGDEYRRAQALSGVAAALAEVGEREAAAQAALQALGAAEAIGDERWKAQALSGVAAALAEMGEREAAAQAALQALGAAEAIGWHEWHEEYKAQALSGVAAALAEVGESEAAAQAALQALGAAEAIGDEYPKAQALSGVAEALAQAGEREAAAQAALQALAAAEAIGHEYHRAQALSRVAAALAEVGDGEALRQALGAAEAIGDAGFRVPALSGVAAALAEVGEREAGAGALRQALAAAEAMQYRQWEAQTLSGVAAALAEVGERGALRQALGLAEAIWWDEQDKAQALSGVAAALAEVGESEAAAQAALQALGAAKAIGDEESRAEALSGAAEALAQAGEREAAAQAALQALAAAEAIGHEYHRAQALSRAAAALAEVGDGEALRQALGAAEAIGDAVFRVPALSGVAAALAEVGEREAGAGALRQALGAAEAIGDEESRAEALSGAAHSWAQIGQPDKALTTFSAAFRAARFAERDSVFSVLGKAAPALAGIEHGQALRQVYDQMMEVESWWGA
jgi:tetratricopeptide (TPR) repeat protein